jgi:hypothetical protein
MCSCEKEIITNSISWADFLIPLLASASGAYVAFKFQDIKETRKQKKNNIAAANISIINLTQQLNCLATYYEDYLIGVKFNSYHCLQLKPFVFSKPTSTAIDFGEISFFVEMKKAGLFQDLLLMQDNFNNWLHKMDMYCEYRCKFEDAYAKNGLVSKEVANETLFVRTEQLAQYIVENTGPMIKDVIDNIKLTKKECIELFGSKSIVTHDIDFDKLIEKLKL